MNPQAATPALTSTSAANEVQDIIAGRVGAGRIRQFLLAAAPTLLRHALRDVLATPETAEFRLVRTRLKPGRKLVAFFDVCGGGSSPRPIAVTWSTDSPMTVLVAPNDPTFPQLTRLYDADHMARIIESISGRTTGKELTVTPIRYRPGQRHMLRIDGPAASDRLFAKTYRDDTGALAVARARTFQSALSAWGGLARTAHPYGYVASDRMALWADSGGKALSQVIAGAPEAAEVAGAALRVLHDSRQGHDESQTRGTTDAAMEGRSTARAVEHVEALRPGTGQHLKRLLDVAVGRLTDLPDETAYPLHGDYKCDNILASDDGLSILDFDRATIGDPALDLGKFCADLQWWTAEAGSPADDLVAAFAEGYGDCPPLRWERAGHYDLLFQLRATGRRVALHDERWTERVDACVANAATRESRQR